MANAHGGPCTGLVWYFTDVAQEHLLTVDERFCTLDSGGAGADLAVAFSAEAAKAKAAEAGERGLHVVPITAQALAELGS